MANGPFDFGNALVQGLAQGRQLQQQKQQSEALNAYRQDQLGLQRDELNKRIQLEQAMQRLREENLAFNKDRATHQDANAAFDRQIALAGLIGGEEFDGPRFDDGSTLPGGPQSPAIPRGAMSPQAFLAQQSAEQSEQMFDVPEVLRGIIGADKLPANAYSSTIPGAFNALNAQRQQRGQADNFNPDVLRNMAELTREQIGDLDTRLQGLDPFSSEAESLAKQRQDLLRRSEGLFEFALSRGVDITDIFRGSQNDEVPAPAGAAETDRVVNPSTGRRDPVADSSVLDILGRGQQQHPRDILRSLIMGTQNPDSLAPGALDAARRFLPSR